MALGYAPGSTVGRDPARQLDELTAARCVRVWVDHRVSGIKQPKPELDALLACARSGDVLTVSELSRLGRTMRGLVVLVGQPGVVTRDDKLAIACRATASPPRASLMPHVRDTP